MGKYEKFAEHQESDGRFRPLELCNKGVAVSFKTANLPVGRQVAHHKGEARNKLATRLQ